jgi:hypothetical protein
MINATHASGNWLLVGEVIAQSADANVVLIDNVPLMRLDRSSMLVDQSSSFCPEMTR